MRYSRSLRRLSATLAGMTVLSSMTLPLVAQDSGKQNAAEQSAAEQNAAITIPDVSGLPDSLRYIQYTPSMCVPNQQQWRSTRPFRPDTVQWGPFIATWHPDAVAEARRCISRFAVATVDPRELLGLGEALLAAGNVPGADSAFTRLVNELTSAPPAERMRGLNRIIAVNMRARPARLAGIEPYLSKLRAMGDSALGVLALTHFQILAIAEQADSLRLMEEHIQSALAAIKKLPPDSAKKYAGTTLDVYRARAYTEARRGEFDKARTTMKEIENIIRRIRPSMGRYVTDDAEAFVLLGTSATPLQAHRWTNVTNVTDASSRTVPQSGKANLVVFVRAECGDQCFEGYSVIRRMMQRYPDLEVTLVLNTGGYYRSMLVSIEKEAELVTEFFNAVLQVDVPMAFWESIFDRRDSDGRLLIRKVPNNEAYRLRELSRALYSGPIAFLIDTQGVIRQNAALSWKTAAMVENTIGEMLQ